jgi:hypothetical protein
MDLLTAEGVQQTAAAGVARDLRTPGERPFCRPGTPGSALQHRQQPHGTHIEVRHRGVDPAQRACEALLPLIAAEGCHPARQRVGEVQEGQPDPVQAPAGV